MKLNFDLTTEEFTLVRNILAETLTPNCRVWVFGSRAKNQARFNSDLDLAIESDKSLSALMLHKVKEAFNDAPLPYKVDILDIDAVSKDFQTIIRQQAKAFPMEIQATAPPLRFPEFSADWTEKRLGDVLEIIGGLTYSPSDIRDDGLLVLRSSNVQKNKITLNDTVFVNLQVDQEKLTKEGDILLCVRNGSQRLICLLYTSPSPRD